MKNIAITTIALLAASSAFAAEPVTTASQNSVFVGAGGTYGVLNAGTVSTSTAGGEIQLGYEFGNHRVKLLGDFITASASAPYNGISKKIDAQSLRAGYSYQIKLREFSSVYAGINGGMIRVNDSVTGNVIIDALGNTAAVSSKANDTTYIVGLEVGANIALSKNWALNVGVEANKVGPTSFTHSALGTSVTTKSNDATLVLGKVGISYKF